MPDVYLTTNVGFLASDVILRTSAVTVEAEEAPAGGNLRRHQGKSTGVDRQIQRFINFRWRFIATVDGELSPLSRPVKFIWQTQIVVSDGVLGLPVRLPTASLSLRAAAQIAASAHVRPHRARLWPDDEEELLILLDLL